MRILFAIAIAMLLATHPAGADDDWVEDGASPTNKTTIAQPAPQLQPAPNITLMEGIGAMEQATFHRTYERDPALARVERLEQNYFPQASDQKAKDLPTRLAELWDKSNPSDDDISAATRSIQPPPSAKQPSAPGPLLPPVASKMANGAKKAAGVGAEATRKILTSPLFWGAAALTGAVFINSMGKSASSTENACIGEWNCTHCSSCEYCRYCNPTTYRVGRCGVWQRIHAYDNP